MVSRRTLEAVLRSHERREQQLLGIIADLSDRLMFLVGRTWVPAPAELAEAQPWRDDPLRDQDDEDADFVLDGEQLIQ